MRNDDFSAIDEFAQWIDREWVAYLAAVEGYGTVESFLDWLDKLVEADPRVRDDNFTAAPALSQAWRPASAIPQASASRENGSSAGLSAP